MSVKIGEQRKDIVWVWRKPGEEFHKDCVNPRKWPGAGKMFWGTFRAGKMGPGLFFQLKPKQKISSTIYRDQVLLGPLKKFREESLSDISDPIVMEDGASVHKGVCKKPRKDMKWLEYLHPSNSPDLNPIENIWAWMKHEITTKYMYVTSKEEMQRIVMEMWENFMDNQWDGLIASMPDRMKAVIKAKGGPTRY
jgi:transposase